MLFVMLYLQSHQTPPFLRGLTIRRMWVGGIVLRLAEIDYYDIHASVEYLTTRGNVIAIAQCITQ